MRFGTIPGIQKPVSRLVMGSMIITTAKMEESFALLDGAIESGINTIDCAHGYAGGNSERCVGLWMEARGNRDKIVIATKGCHHNADRKRVTPHDLTADLMDSLARLRTDHVDLYFLHRDDPSLPVGPIVEALNEHRSAGRIRAFGGSNWTSRRIAEANAYAAEHGLTPFVASSPNFGLAEQVENPWGEGCASLSGPTNAADREWHRKNRIAVFAYSSLGRGFFSGRLNRENYREVADDACIRAYCHEVNFRRLDRCRELAEKKGCSIAQLALAWTLAQPLEIHALVGAASQEEIEQNRAALDIALNETELAYLEAGNPD